MVNPPSSISVQAVSGGTPDISVISKVRAYNAEDMGGRQDMAKMVGGKSQHILPLKSSNELVIEMQIWNTHPKRR